MAVWRPGIRKYVSVVYLKGRGLCRGVNAWEQAAGQPKDTEFAQGHHWGHWLILQVWVGIDMCVLSLLAAWSKACRDGFYETQHMQHSYYGVNISASLGDAVRLQRCHRTPNSLKRSHHKVPGMSSVCLGALQGAKQKLCISRQALIFQIQGATSSVSTTAASPNEQLRYSGFCSPCISLWEDLWIRTKYENVPVFCFLMETIYSWNVKLCVRH